MKNIKMIATDLDGTLLDSNLLLSNKNKMILQKMMSLGIHIVPCSGRPFSGMEHIIKEIGLTKDDYCISYNGSLVQSCDGKNILHEAEISSKAFKEIYDFFSKFGLGVHAMTRDSLYTYDKHIHQLTVRESYLGKIPIKVLDKHNLVTEKIIKIMAVGESGDLNIAMESFANTSKNCFSLNKSEDYYLEIMQNGDNKAHALSILLDELNITSDEVMAFGNNLNDIDMINFAGVGVAVENAVFELKEVSDYITKSNNEDGVAQFLECFYLKKR
ncbi:HAD family phosphatase [Tuanshanicoccus lijuaniae]|uniref:Cof-type HAD-IIB family hydrolase n=1 Tax=Aerococcaceae bacterium zg-1292 TaxID=2774330 RepID=UPI00193889EC|nr:HAD family phosphatase [Aerococcaceae bacterium zg-1292]QQA36873.1 HAD family phosphatase [Aerococcaceae bacterium zg-1292]